MKTILLILLLQPVRITWTVLEEPDHKAINMLYAQKAIYNEAESEHLSVTDTLINGVNYKVVYLTFSDSSLTNTDTIYFNGSFYRLAYRATKI